MALMKKTVALALALCALINLKAQDAPQGRFIADQIVAVVGGSAIFYSEIKEYADQLQQDRRQKNYTSDRDPVNEALEGLMIQKLLYNQALVDSVEVNKSGVDQMVEENVREMIRQKGSVAALEAFYKKPVYEIRDDLTRRVTEVRTAQTMQSQLESKVAVTPGEVNRFYRSFGKDSLPLVPDQYVYAQITKFPASLALAKQRTRERMIEFRERILAGARFEVLARAYSVDGASAIRGGEMDAMRKDQFVAPFAEALARLKPGQVSEVVETEYGYHIIQLISKDGDLYRCRHILLRPTFTVEELMATTNSLDSLARVIRAGETTFEKAAAEHSDDKYSKLNGGVVSNHDIIEHYNAYDAGLTSTRFKREDIMPEKDAPKIIALKPGEISAAFMTTDLKGNELGKIVKLLSVIPTHTANINDDYLDLERMALQAKQDKEFNKWLDDKIATMYIRIDPAFHSDQFENKNWLK